MKKKSLEETLDLTERLKSRMTTHVKLGQMGKNGSKSIDYLEFVLFAIKAEMEEDNV